MNNNIFFLVELSNGEKTIIHKDNVDENKKVIKLYPTETEINYNKIITDDIFFVDLGISENIDLYCNENEDIFYVDNYNNESHTSYTEALSKEEVKERFGYEVE